MRAEKYANLCALLTEATSVPWRRAGKVAPTRYFRRDVACNAHAAENCPRQAWTPEGRALRHLLPKYKAVNGAEERTYSDVCFWIWRLGAEADVTIW